MTVPSARPGGTDKPLSGAWQRDFEYGSGTLALLLVMAGTYLAGQATLPDSTEYDRVYGIGGMLLGLFICARPAKNAIDVLIFERQALRRVMRGVRGLAWLCLNALVMGVGCFVIIVGALRMSVK